MYSTRSRNIHNKTDAISKREYVCLGFALGKSDKIRLNNLYTCCNSEGDKVSIVAANNSQDNTHGKSGYLYSHKECQFSSTSGLASVITSNTVMVILDYFWLQPGYYQESYSLNWAVPKGQVEYLLTKTNVKKVILPLDTSNDLIKSIEANKKFLTTFSTIHYLSHKQAKTQHPLVRADQLVDTDIPKDRGSCNDQLLRYTLKEKAFVVFEKKNTQSEIIIIEDDS